MLPEQLRKFTMVSNGVEPGGLAQHLLGSFRVSLCICLYRRINSILPALFSMVLLFIHSSLSALVERFGLRQAQTEASCDLHDSALGSIIV